MNVPLIADTLKNGKEVAFYGATSESIQMITELSEVYQILPSFIIDGDNKKHGKMLLGVPILSLQQALERGSEFYIYIASRTYKYQMIGNLLVASVSSERIMNFESVERRRSCNYLEGHIVIVDHKLQFCCSDFGKGKSPYVNYIGDANSTIKKFIEYRRENLKNIKEHKWTECGECPYITEDWYPINSKIVLINYAEGGICNFECIYCNSDAKNAKNNDAKISFIDTIKSLRLMNLLADDAEYLIDPGEISVHPQRTDILNLCKKNRTIIFTNGCVFRTEIADMLGNGAAVLNISIDAGTRETFNRVKGIDCFYEVRENLIRYGKRSARCIEPKYIFLPGINDNEEDVDGFVNLCNDISAGIVQISSELNTPLGDHTIAMVKRMINKLEFNNLIYRVITDKVKL